MLTLVFPSFQLQTKTTITQLTHNPFPPGRQRLSSLSEDSNSSPLLALARFGLAPPPPPGSGRAPAHLALYVMAASGQLLHLLLHPKPSRSVPKEKVCDETAIELEVEGVAQWGLQRPPAPGELLAPLPASSPLLAPPCQVLTHTHTHTHTHSELLAPLPASSPLLAPPCQVLTHIHTHTHTHTHT
ncbi:hypothetical protein JYU34_009387 [Plutella xylostella]|uniref:Uncharacterized protein n=1 Tax=Plutella xylostella TaxID=51655 RepID=A0ABQ7QKL1_PLUXY|nr:hypothetical protein JYU34_009387 [Plutella xylostella]